MPGPRASLVVALVVGAALAVLAVQALVLLAQQPVAHGAWRVGLSAVVVTGVWWLLNGPLEGPTVVAFSREHGLTVGDLLGVPALLAGAALFALAVRA